MCRYACLRALHCVCKRDGVGLLQFHLCCQMLLRLQVNCDPPGNIQVKVVTAQPGSGGYIAIALLAVSLVSVFMTACTTSFVIFTHFCSSLRPATNNECSTCVHRDRGLEHSPAVQSLSEPIFWCAKPTGVLHPWKSNGSMGKMSRQPFRGLGFLGLSNMAVLPL